MQNLTYFRLIKKKNLFPFFIFSGVS